MKKASILIFVLLIAGSVIFYLYRENAGQKTAPVRLSGNIEVVEVQLSFRIAGWVSQRPIDEGQKVTAGQLAAKIDPSELEIEIQQRQSAVSTAKAALAELEAGSRPEEIATSEASADRAKSVLDELLAGSRPQDIDAAKAAVDRAKAQSQYAQLDYDRVKDSTASGAISQSQRDSSRMALDTALAALDEAKQKLSLLQEGPRKEEIAQARASLAEAQSRFTLLKNGPRKETIEQARSRVMEAENALAYSKNRLAFATLNCPVDGVVLSKNVEPGEYVAAGTPIVTLANLKKPWLRVYIPEPDLGKVKIGQKAVVRADAYPNKQFEGRVSFISSEAEFTPKSVQTDKERVKLVYRVKIDLENPDLELKPGMPADAELLAE
jgi:HlyD family secretion protein